MQQQEKTKQKPYFTFILSYKKLTAILEQIVYKIIIKIYQK